MSEDPKKEKKEKDGTKTPKKHRAAPQKEKKKKEEKSLASYAEVAEEVKKIDIEKPKALEELASLFEAFRVLKDLSNNQIEDFLLLVMDKAGTFYVSILAKMATSLCQNKHDCDLKIISAIRAFCKERFEKFGIHEGDLTNAERNVCLQVKGDFVTQFLKDAYKQGQKSDSQISNAELAGLTFACLTLYCKLAYEGDAKIQKAIDQAIAEFFSSYEISGIKERELTGKTIGNIISAKVFSSRRMAELTYLYAGTTDLIAEQVATIRNQEEIKRTQAAKIESLTGDVKAAKAQNQALQEQIDALHAENGQLIQDREAAENMLEYEKNKFAKLLQSQKSGLADQLTADIALELQALRELVEHLEPGEQNKINRRLNRIDEYLREFGGDQ